MNDYIKQFTTNIMAFYNETVDAIETTHRGDIDVTLINFRTVGQSVFTTRDGELLKALNTLLKTIIKEKFPDSAPFLVDIDNYYFHYIEDLKHATREMIEKVKHTQKPVILPPQNSFDRLLVHHFIKEDSEVSSTSEGEGFERHIIISVKSV